MDPILHVHSIENTIVNVPYYTMRQIKNLFGVHSNYAYKYIHLTRMFAWLNHVDFFFTYMDAKSQDNEIKCKFKTNTTTAAAGTATAAKKKEICGNKTENVIWKKKWNSSLFSDILAVAAYF